MEPVSSSFSALKILSCLCGTCTICVSSQQAIEDKIHSYDGLYIPYMCETDITKNIQSDTIEFIDLQNELKDELDEDDLRAIETKTSLNANRLIYNKSKEIVKQIDDIYTNSSNQHKHFVFVSSDYRLLKYVHCTNIHYLCPSDSYHNELKQKPEWNEDKYQVCRTDLLSRKKDKIIVYSSANDLIEHIIKIYPDATIKI